MKKILLLLLMGVCISAVSQTTKRIYHYKELVGVIKKSDGSYIKQELNSSSNTIQIGYNQNTGKLGYGRGYLEFDLSGIPKNVNVTSASLQIATANSFASNFNGKIQIYQSSLFRFADEAMYNSIGSTIGLPIFEYTFAGEGQGVYLSNDHLKAVVKDCLGRNLYLAIRHTNESKVANLSGEQDFLYLSVTYTESLGGGGTTDPCTINAQITGKKEVQKGETVTYRFQGGIPTFWGFNSYCFEEIERPGSAIVLKAKEYIKEARISASRWESSTNPNCGMKITQGETYVSIIPDFKISYVGDCVACANESKTYSVPLPEGATVAWEAGNNLTLISGQGTANATFRTSGNGYGVIKATVEYNKVYNLLNSDVWVGVPAAPTRIISSHGITEGCTLNSSGFLAEFEAEPNNYMAEYKWVFDGTVYPEWKTSYFRCKIPYMGTSITSFHEVKASVTNKCGTSPTKTLSFYVKNQGGGGILRSLSSDIEKDINPVNVRVYDLSGKIVYTQNNVTGELDLRSTSLYDGIYIIEKYDGKNVTRDKVMLKR